MKHLKHALALFCFASLLGVPATSASPEMGAASEATSADSTALPLLNVVSLAAVESEPLDLIGLDAAWSEAAKLNTCPFVGTLITIQ